ncbi:hypothetical protein QUF88_15795 [Bacillus sp. DX1.1]|uniref:hypothetical protein n=1 Tax=unclassified Bacillus (in: firmicutes) TaxID=185979 RepID=UPI0025712D8A|nr:MULTISPECIES: hypothetical protein [unclassified Bacillus (in: firmicutes)]MDM5155216.1 hypothetical protein [Bacillus sp. DX1.1]WJE79536.1 hypothetical protein QRE67_13290 [Bacillus sp. DX3.1]
MLKKVFFALICICFLSTNTMAQTNKQIEVFDCQKEMVIQKQSLDTTIQKEAIQYAKSITGVYRNLNVVPKIGHMIKIPLSKPVTITNQWIHTNIDEVLILLPLKEKPYIMIYDDENNPHFYYVQGHPEGLLKQLKIKSY